MPSAVRKVWGVILIFGSLAVVVTVVIASFWTLHSPTPAQTSLTPAEVHQIMSVVSSKRWELVRFALRKREFKLLRHFFFARIDSVDADSAAGGKATVRCRVAFESGVRVVMTLEREGTNGWRFYRWVVAEEIRKHAPQRALSGTPASRRTHHKNTKCPSRHECANARLTPQFPSYPRSVAFDGKS